METRETLAYLFLMQEGQKREEGFYSCSAVPCSVTEITGRINFHSK
jgi:hypothetical protein